jgi:hypothetical protein
MKVLRQLGIAEEVASRLHAYPNGATAMRALAGTTAAGLVGCTQITEIKSTPGVALVGALPPWFRAVDALLRRRRRRCDAAGRRARTRSSTIRTVERGHCAENAGFE